MISGAWQALADLADECLHAPRLLGLGGKPHAVEVGRPHLIAVARLGGHHALQVLILLRQLLSELPVRVRPVGDAALEA